MKQAVVEGIGTLEFPDDTPDEVIDKTVKREIRQKSVADDNAKTRQMAIDDTTSPFLVAAGRGMMDVVQGVKQLFAGDDDYTRKTTQELELYNRLAEQHPVQAFTGRLVGNAAAAPVPGGIGANAATRVATAAAGGGLAAGTMFTPEGESRVKNMAIGALTGAGMQGVVGEPLRAMGKRISSTPADRAERQTVTEAGKRLGVPVYLPDVTESPLTKELSVLAEKGGPLGTAGGRLDQADAARTAAQTTLARLKGNHQLGDLSDDIRASLGDRLARFQKIKTGKYARAAKVADAAGDIPTPRFDQTVQQGISEIQSRGIASPELVSKLEAAFAAPRGPFSVINALDDDLGETVSSFYTGQNAAIAKKGVQYFQAAKTALRADIDAHLKAAQPNAVPLIREADKFYQDNILPFKRTQLAKIVSDKANFQPEQAWKFVERNADSPTMMRALYGSLTPNGRVAVKAGLMRQAIDEGFVVPREGGAKVFSPGRVAGYLEDKLALVNAFMKPDEAAEFQGMVKLFRAIQRSGQVAENPPTGARVVLPALLASSFFSPKSAALIGGGLLTAKTVFTTEAVRKLLVKLAELPIDHPKTASITNEIAAALRNRIPGPLVQPTIQEEE